MAANGDTPGGAVTGTTTVYVMLALCLLAGFANARAEEGDVEAGRRVFDKCLTCHTLDPFKQTVGPNLLGVVGREAGAVANFRYSPGMRQAAKRGLVWTEVNLIAYIANPGAFLRTYLEKTKPVPFKMTFKLKDLQDRIDVITYLKEFEPGS